MPHVADVPQHRARVLTLTLPLEEVAEAYAVDERRSITALLRP